MIFKRKKLTETSEKVEPLKLAVLDLNRTLSRVEAAISKAEAATRELNRAVEKANAKREGRPIIRNY